MNSIYSFFNFSIRNFFFSTSKDQTSNSKVDNLLFHISFFASLISVYILSIQDNNFVLMLKKGIFVLVPTLMGLRVFLTKKLNFWYLPLLVLIGIYFFLVRRVEVIGEFILLSWCIFLFSFKPTFKFSPKQIWALGFTLCVIVGIHFYFYENYHRESIGGLDPNYSSFLIFLLLPMALYSRSVLIHLFITCLGLLTQSRAFFVAMIIYFAVLVCMKLFKNVRLSFKTYLGISTAFFLILVGYSYYAYFLGESSFGQSMAFGFERLLYIFNNPSDFQRWKANVVFFQLTSSDWQFFLYGMDPLIYLKKINLFLPHNVPLLELATHGVFIGTLFLLFFVSFIKRIYSWKYIPFYSAILVYWLLLGVEIGAVYNVYLINLMLLLEDK